MLVFAVVIAPMACAESPTSVESAPLRSALCPQSPREEEVEFPSAGLTIKGTLTLPSIREGETCPAVVLIHGSGPHNRNEPLSGQLGMQFGFSIPVFTEIAQGLARAGVATLRYDKRTCGPFNGCAKNGYPAPRQDITIDDFILDAQAALDWLRHNEMVDPDAIFIVGHSQGAQLIPPILVSRPWVRSGVMLAAPYSAVDATIAMQARTTRELLRNAGMQQEQIDGALSELDGAISSFAALRAGTFAGRTILGVGVPFWRSWLNLTDRLPSTLPEVKQPLYVVSGSYDWNVPPSENELWRSAFSKLPSNPGHTNRVVDCVTHALNCVHQPDATKVTLNDVEHGVYAELLDGVIGHLRHVARGGVHPKVNR